LSNAIRPPNGIPALESGGRRAAAIRAAASDTFRPSARTSRYEGPDPNDREHFMPARSIRASAPAIAVRPAREPDHFAGDRPTAEGFARRLAAIAPIDERIQVLARRSAARVIQGPLPFRLLVNRCAMSICEYLRDGSQLLPRPRAI